MSAARKASGEPLCEHVKRSVEKYFEDLNGEEPSNLHELVISQVERPLLEIVMRQARGNVSAAARMLGLNRATLRSRLTKHGLKDK